MESIPFGLRGYYGLSLNTDYNKKIVDVNLLIDEYNEKINTFETFEDQIQFNKKINKEINELMT